MENKPTIGFIGAGNMAHALITGILKSGSYQPEDITVSAPTDRNLDKYESLGFLTTHDNTDICKKCSIIFLCVKPHLITPVLNKLQGEIPCVLSGNHLVISVAAGITLAKLQPLMPGCRVIRTMPNTPCMVGAGIVLYSRGRNATFSDCELLSSLLKPCAMCEEVPETLIDSAGALSGCGPAYIFTMMQGLADGAVKLGVPRDLALKLTAQTITGSAQMVLESGRHPIELRDQVCSPGGSTIEGVAVLERKGIKGILMDALEASAKKNKELGTK